MRTYFIVSIGLLLAGLLLALPARSQSSVDDLIEQGVRMRESGHDAEALADFRKAFELSKGARAQALMALAEQALGQWVRAEVDLLAALALADDRWIASQEAELRAALATVREHLGDLELSGGTQGAEVLLDGIPVGKLPLQRPIRSETGSRTLMVRAPGYYPLNKTVVITQNGTSRVALEIMSRDEASAATAATAPSSNAATRSKPAESGKAGRNRVLGWTFVGAAGVLAGFGVVALVMRADHVGGYNDSAVCPGTHGATQPSSCQSDMDASHTWTALAWGSFIGSSLAAGAATYVFLSTPSKSVAHVSCASSLLSLGMTCRGSF